MNQKASKIVGLRELRENTNKYIKAIQKGASFTVMRRSEPLFQITPVSSDNKWEEVIDFTEISPEGVPATTVLERLEQYGG